MRVLLVNKFFYRRGGSETVFFDTAKILEEHGHEVVFFSMNHPENIDSAYSRYFVSHVDFDEVHGFLNALRVTGRVLYSVEAHRKIERLLKNERPDIIHLHNIHHQLSPSILYVLKDYHRPVVMTLHDYKMVCPVYTMLARDGICERCRNRRFFHCLLQKCAKGSLSRSLVSTAEMYLHRSLLHTDRVVDLFISPSQFLRDKLAEMGFQGTVRHLPNSIDVKQYAPSYSWSEQTIVYFGRLSAEKGLLTLVDAVGGLPLTCRIIGEGPLRPMLERRARQRGFTNLLFLGYKDREELKEEISGAMFVVAPSEWYENNPVSVIEAFACGKPVVAARIGGLPELVEHEETGLLFPPGDVNGLRECVLQLLASPARIGDYGRNARARVEQRFSRTRYADGLLRTYREAIKKHEAS